MTIFQVCPYDFEQHGGVQHHIAQLSETLVEKGHEVYILAPYSSKKGKELRKISPLIRLIKLTKAKRIRLWGTSIDLTYLTESEKIETDKILVSSKPQVIHFHTIWNPVFQHQLLNRVPKGITKIATFHDTPPDHGLGRWVGGGLIRRAIRYYLPRLDAAISVSKSQVSAMGLIPSSLPSNFHIIPNGIKFHQDTVTKKIGRGQKQCPLLYIGRLEPRKGILDLLRAYKNLVAHQELKSEKAVTIRKPTLNIVGSGPMLAQVKSFITKNDLQDIHIYTSADESTKQKLLIESEILIAPSLYGESFGIVLLEGMAAGLKILAYGNEGYLNLGRKYGVENFPEPGNIDALTQKMLEHILYPESTDHLIKKGYEIAELHNWDSLSDKILKVYQ